MPLNAELLRAINQYLEVRPSASSDRLLIGQRGEFTRIAINKLLEKYSKQMLLEYTVTPHMARHTAFTMMIKNGTDIKTVQQIAGHSSAHVTYKFYIASTAEDTQNAVNNLPI
ncbi:hypothetical protein CUU64_18625 [Bacillus sp. V5-8f]|nr:hypothetical protein CUU64_18625 [Bacillus sp. V5-8f]